jgi:predicted MFS family arabinose efflux permease
VELLHGITFGVFISAVVHQTSELAPQGTETAAQGLMAGVQAAGSLVGIVLGGVVYEYSGGRDLFQAMAVAMVLVLACYTTLLPRYRAQAEQGPALATMPVAVDTVTEPLLEAEGGGSEDEGQT